MNKTIFFFQQLGISRNGGLFNASMLIDGKYIWKEITTVTMLKLIQLFGLQNIDYLFLDVEGAEYDLLPDIIQKIDLEHIPICQVTAFYFYSNRVLSLTVLNIWILLFRLTVGHRLYVWKIKSIFARKKLVLMKKKMVIMKRFLRGKRTNYLTLIVLIISDKV